MVDSDEDDMNEEIFSMEEECHENMLNTMLPENSPLPPNRKKKSKASTSMNIVTDRHPNKFHDHDRHEHLRSGSTASHKGHSKRIVLDQGRISPSPFAASTTPPPIIPTVKTTIPSVEIYHQNTFDQRKKQSELLAKQHLIYSTLDSVISKPSDHSELNTNRTLPSSNQCKNFKRPLSTGYFNHRRSTGPLEIQTRPSTSRKPQMAPSQNRIHLQPSEDVIGVTRYDTSVSHQKKLKSTVTTISHYQVSNGTFGEVEIIKDKRDLPTNIRSILRDCSPSTKNKTKPLQKTKKTQRRILTPEDVGIFELEDVHNSRQQALKTLISSWVGIGPENLSDSCAKKSPRATANNKITSKDPGERRKEILNLMHKDRLVMAKENYSNPRKEKTTNNKSKQH